MEAESNEMLSVMSVSRPFTSSIQKIEYKTTLPMGVEQYLQYATRLQNLEKNSMKFYKGRGQWKNKDVHVRLAKMSDTETVANLHRDVYRGHYPYHEMLDHEYLQENILNPEKGFVSLFGFHEREKEIIGGCGILNTDKETRTGYLRGLMVLPEYQEAINLKDLVCTAVKYGFKNYSEIADKWYVETRTAHTKAQFMMELFGCRPCAIFPNKDIFTGETRRESDVLLTSYLNPTLYEMRNSEPILTPKLADLYEFIAKRHNLQDATFKQTNIFDEQYSDVLKKAEKIRKKITITKEESKFNRINYELRTESGSSLKFMVTRTVECGEKAELDFKSYEDLIALLVKTDDLMKEEDIEYFELYFPAIDHVSQEIFLALNFSVFGYVPAWHQNAAGKLDDCIVFGKYKQNLDPDELCLTNAGYELLQVVERYLH